MVGKLFRENINIAGSDIVVHLYLELEIKDINTFMIIHRHDPTEKKRNLQLYLDCKFCRINFELNYFDCLIF